jgi:hypothetical protein
MDAIMTFPDGEVAALQWKTVKVRPYQGMRPIMLDYDGIEDIVPNSIHMDRATDCLIVAVQPLYQDYNDLPDDDDWDMPWTVRDILSGQIYTRAESMIGSESFNEMEVLAWAAENHPDVEISGD